MKRFLKLVVGLLVAYLLYRLLVEYLRPMRIKLEEQLSPVTPDREPTPPPAATIAPPPRPLPEPDLLNLNQADVASLVALPGIGPALAERIVTYRQQVGAFASFEDLTDVPGIGPALVERLRALVTLS
jgi:competence ComEA-like helix-hairpin-helix protein